MTGYECLDIVLDHEVLHILHVPHGGLLAVVRLQWCVFEDDPHGVVPMLYEIACEPFHLLVCEGFHVVVRMRDRSVQHLPVTAIHTNEVMGAVVERIIKKRVYGVPVNVYSIRIPIAVFMVAGDHVDRNPESPAYLDEHICLILIRRLGTRGILIDTVSRYDDEFGIDQVYLTDLFLEICH